MKNTEVIQHIISDIPNIEKESPSKLKGVYTGEAFIRLRTFLSELPERQFQSIVAIRNFGRGGESDTFDRAFLAIIDSSLSQEMNAHELVVLWSTLERDLKRALKLAEHQGLDLDEI